MKIVRAAPSDAARLSAIAQAAKAHWGYPAHWLQQWREQLTVTPKFLQETDTFTARLNRELIGFYALVRGEESLNLEHLWVAPPWLGRGFGRRLFTHAIEHARRRGAPSLTIEADPHAEAFYLHLGAVRVGFTRGEIDNQARELPLLHFALQPVR